ncbi:MAG: diphthine synthase [Thermoplasmata archaeon]
MGSLTFIGLGLWDYRDMSIRAREAIQNAEVVFAEFYTAFLGGCTLQELSAFTGKEIRVLTRKQVEEEDIVFRTAISCDVAFLCAGDALAATTHQDILIRAKKYGINTSIIPGTSIFTAAAGLAGLQHYKFGKTTTIPFPEEHYFPTSPLEVIKKNRDLGLHTLVLLDIRVMDNTSKTASTENPETIIPDTSISETIRHYRCMSANTGFSVLRKMEEKCSLGVIHDDLLVVALARAGSPDALVVAGRLRDVERTELGPPMHSIIIPGELHYLEEEAINIKRVPKVSGAGKAT